MRVGPRDAQVSNVHTHTHAHTHNPAARAPERCSHAVTSPQGSEEEVKLSLWAASALGSRQGRHGKTIRSSPCLHFLAWGG